MKKYDDEFKQNAVKKMLDGQSVASVARELGVGEGPLHTAVGNERALRRLPTPSAKSSSSGKNYVKSKWNAAHRGRTQYGTRLGQSGNAAGKPETNWSAPVQSAHDQF